MTDMKSPATTSSKNAGTVYWITGLPGAGKSTFARALTRQLNNVGTFSLLMDGDDVRSVFGDVFGFDRESRRSIGGTYGRLAAYISQQGFNVICATTSMFNSVYEWNRKHIPCYNEIFIDAPTSLIVRRHPHGLYARGIEKRVKNVPGVDQTIDPPRNADFTIHNDESMCRSMLEEMARQVIEKATCDP